MFQADYFDVGKNDGSVSRNPSKLISFFSVASLKPLSVTNNSIGVRKTTAKEATWPTKAAPKLTTAAIRDPTLL